MPKQTDSKALLPLVVPLMEKPIEGDIEDVNGGLGIRHIGIDWVVYLINPKDGVHAGSVVSLHMGNAEVPVSHTPIRVGEENIDLIPLAVPAHLVREYFLEPVFAKLRRAGGNTSETERLKLRILLRRPGGDDPNGEEPGHQGLVMEIAPEVMLQGVDEATALKGVDIIIRHWEHMHLYDLIILAWGSQQVLHRVQPEEVGRDITLNVKYDTISAAGNSQLTRVAFRVKGATGNMPDERAPWSAVKLIDVHLNEQRPAAPYLLYPDTYPDRIDLVELGSAPAQIGVWVSSGEATAYESVTLIWAGTDSEGNIIPHTESRNLDRSGPHLFDIPNAKVEAVAKGTAFVHVLFQGNGLPDLPSKKLPLDIVGETSRWPAPKIKEDLGGHLDPGVAATVYFPLQGSWPGDGYLEVIFRVSGPDVSIEHRVGREVDDIPPVNGHMEFTVYPDELSRFVGYRVEVFYAHTQPGGRPHESLRLTIAVGEIQRTMPAPEMNEAIGGQLNPSNIGAFARALSTFNETKQNDGIHMHFYGPYGGTVVEATVAVDGSITTHNIARSFVLENQDEFVQLYYTLTRGNLAPRYSAFTDLYISRGVAELLAPVLLGANITGTTTAELRPLNVEQGTKVVVSYRGMLNIDTITVTLQGNGIDGSPIIPPKPGNQAEQKVEFDITAAAIAANIGDTDQTFTLSYAVTRNGQTVFSATLTVTVKPIPLSALPQIIINGVAHNGLLDLNIIAGNLLASGSKWPFSRPGQRVWITLSASNYEPLQVLTNYSVTAQEALMGLANKTVLRSWLQQLTPNTQITAKAWVTLDGSGDRARAIMFLPTAYKVKRIPGLSDITNFNNNNYNGWSNYNARGELVNPAGNTYWIITKTNAGLLKIYADGHFTRTNSYEISFDCINSFAQAQIGVQRRNEQAHHFRIPVSSGWNKIKYTAILPVSSDRELIVLFRTHNEGKELALDNIIITAL